MNQISEELRQFSRRRQEFEAHSRQTAALFLVAGIDMTQLMSSPEADRRAALLRIGRLVERERQKGARRHWSYALNRHIALKQALERLMKSLPPGTVPHAKAAPRLPGAPLQCR